MGVQFTSLGNGMVKISYNGQEMEVTEKQAEQLKRQPAGTIESVFAANAANKSEATTTATGTNTGDGIAALNQQKEEQINQEVEKFTKQDPNEQIRQLPEEYATQYQAIEDDENLSPEQKLEQQKEVIKNFFKDTKYNPEQIAGPDTYGNRSSIGKSNGITFQTVLDDSNMLMDGDGKPIKENVEARAEVVKQSFIQQQQQQLDAIDARTDLTDVQKQKAKENLILEQAFDTSLGPQVHELAEANKKNLPMENENTYYELAMTNEQKNHVNERTNQIADQMSEILNKDPSQLTQADKDQLQAWKEEYNRKFPDEKFGDFQNLANISKGSEAEKKTAFDRLSALAKSMAIDEEISAEQKSSGAKDISTDLNEDQMEKLAKAQMRESVVHENEIQKLTQEMIYLESKTDKTDADTKRIDQIKKQITKLDKNKDKMLNNIREGSAQDAANAEVKFEMYKQKFENTEVHWNKSASKSAEKQNPGANNTYLNDYTRKLIMNDKDFRDQTCKPATKETGDFEVDGQWYKLDSKMYKEHMQRLSNAHTDYGDNDLHSSYYVSTSEWADFANEHAQKGNGKPATMGERSDVREMFEVAGLEVAGDRTYAMRAGKIGKAALAGAGAGALAGLGGELLNSAKSIKYSGAASAIAEGIATSTITGVATGSYSGTVSGSETVNFTSQIQELNPKTGEYVTVAEQTTPHTVNWSGDYSGTVDVPYQKQVDIPYSKEVSADYNGSVKPGFDWGNVGKGAGIGAAVGGLGQGLKYLFKKKTAADYVDTNTAKDYKREDTGYKTEHKVQDAAPVEVSVQKTEVVPGEDKVEPIDIQNTDHKMTVRRGRGTMLYKGQQVPFNEAENKKYYVQQLYGLTDDQVDAVYKYIMENINELPAGKYGDAQYVNGNTYHFPETIPAGTIPGIEGELGQQDMSNYVPKWIKIPHTSGRYRGFTGGEGTLQGQRTVHGDPTTRTTTRTDDWRRRQ